MMEKWGVDDFLSQYSSINTRKMYHSFLRDYFKLFYPELNKHKDIYKFDNKLHNKSLEYVQKDKDFRKDLLAYKQHIINQAPKTISSKIAAVIRFLESNQIKFNKNFTRNLYGTGGDEAITREHVPDKNEIARLIEYMPINARTLTLVLASSGMRVGEALKIKLDDISLDSNPTEIYLRPEYTKTKKKRTVFVSSEAKELLVEWLSYRKRYLENKTGQKGMLTKDLRLFPFSGTNYRSIWNLALKKAGLHEVDPKTRRVSLRPHNLRKFFRTYGRWGNPDVAEALMGHTSGLNSVYTRLDQAEDILREEYLRVEPNLSIYQNTQVIVELCEKVNHQSEDIEQLVTGLSLKNVRLENRLGDQEVKIGRLLDANQRLLDTVLSQGERMDVLQRTVEGLSQRVFDASVVEQRRVLVDRGLEGFSGSLGDDGLVRVCVSEK
jgi:integrase